MSHNLPAEENCSCISKCFYSIIHIKELSVIVKIPKKKGNKTIFSSQEATQLIFMDSEWDEVDLGENYCEDSDKESDWEPDQEDLDTQSEQEDEDFNSPRPSRNEN